MPRDPRRSSPSKQVLLGPKREAGCNRAAQPRSGEPDQALIVAGGGTPEEPGSCCSRSPLPAHALPLHQGSKKIPPGSGPCIRTALKPGEEQEGREHTLCQLRCCQQPAPQLPPRRPELDGNWLQFPPASAQACCAVSLPIALALSHLHNTGCSFLPAIEVTASRTETTKGERKQQQEERSCPVQGQEQKGRPSASRDPTSSTAPLSPPMAILEAMQPPPAWGCPPPALPWVQCHAGWPQGKTLGLVWLLGQRGAQIPRPGWGALTPLLIPWGCRLVWLTNPQHGAARVGGCPPPRVLGHPPSSSPSQPSCSRSAQSEPSPQTNHLPKLPAPHRLRAYFVSLNAAHRIQLHAAPRAQKGSTRALLLFIRLLHTHKKKKPPRGLT